MTRLIFNGKSLRNDDGVLSMPPVYYDWALPTQSGVASMSTNLHDYGLGNFSGGYYWCSNEGSPSNGTVQSMGSGTSLPKGEIHHVRPMRDFTAAEGAYSLRDTGPAGGFICFINGTNYYEAWIEDLDDSVWSNITNQSVGSTSAGIQYSDSNTQTIIDQPGHITSAALLCTQLITYGDI